MERGGRPAGYVCKFFLLNLVHGERFIEIGGDNNLMREYNAIAKVHGCICG